MPSDLHIHTRFSADATGEPEQFITRGIELGLSAIGFSEHWDFDPDDRSYGFYDYNVIHEEVNRLRQKYAKEIEVLLGVEVNYTSDREDEIRDALAGKDFDYVIGGVHAAGGIYVSEATCRQDLARLSAPEVYVPFFEETNKAIESGLFDIIAHLDLCKRYGVEFYGTFDVNQAGDRMVESVLRRMVTACVAMEINTSGTREAPREPYPGRQLLEMYRDAGGQLITIGSDAHRPENTGCVAAAAELIAEVGLPDPVFYKGRGPIT